MPYVGVVLRSHAGGYLVHVSGHGEFREQSHTDSGRVLFCQARGRLKKERVAIVTGDSVEVDEVDEGAGTAVITAQLPRRNLLERPTLANVDQVVIVQAVKQPDFSPLWCDRYLVHFQLELPVSKPVLCFNKCDLVDDFDLETLRSIYEPLGYFVIFVSAVTGAGIEELSMALSGRISVFAGPSGVGKSSILNELSPELDLKTGVMENDFGVGRHTTTASELYRLRLRSDPPTTLTWVADTPGFNLYDFLHPEPKDVAFQFPEIEALKQNCRFTDCLHLVESGCAVLNALPKSEDEDGEALPDGPDATSERSDEPLASATISLSRYASYLTLVQESLARKEESRSVSKKVESNVKSVGGEAKAKSIPRLNQRYRFSSRRKEKQDLRNICKTDSGREGGHESLEETDFDQD